MGRGIAKLLLEVAAVSLQPSNPFTYSSGIKSPIYCDNRVLISHTKKRREVVESYLKVLEGLDFDILAGTSTAGIPWCAWLAEKTGKPMVYVRGEKKGHGKQNRIEGVLEDGQKAVIVEDLVSTGGSSVSAVKAVRESGGVVEDCVAIFTYSLEKAKKAFEEADCNLHTLTEFSELASEAVNLELISEREKEIVENWREDPEGWKDE